MNHFHVWVGAKPLRSETTWIMHTYSYIVGRLEFRTLHTVVVQHPNGLHIYKTARTRVNPNLIVGSSSVAAGGAHRRFAGERRPVGAEGGKIGGFGDVRIPVKLGSHVSDHTLDRQNGDCTKCAKREA